MIPATGPEQTVLQAKTYRIYLRIEVANASAVYLDYSDYVDLDLQDRAEVSIDADARIKQATLELIRESSGNSLAPLLNSDIAVGRGVRISAAKIAAGATPVGGDYKPLLAGTVDEWGHPEVSGEIDENRLTLVARDGLAVLQDRQIEDETDYGSEAGTALETVMQSIINDWGGGVSLYVPSPTGILAGPFRQKKGSVLEAVQSLADLIGWVVEDRWDSGTAAWRITLYEPDRTPSGTDWTFGPDDYSAVVSLGVARYHIRNAITVRYTDAATGARGVYTAEDPTSIAKYGRRWMEIEEADDSPINSEALAQGMADPALLDLSEPDALQEIRGPLFWPVQLDDYYEFLANGVHYDTDQEFGVVGYTHVLENGTGETRIRTRGKPVGSVRGWLNRQNKLRPLGEAANALEILNFREISRTATEIVYAWELGSDLAMSWIHDYQEAQPYSTDRWPDGSRLPVVVTDERTVEYTVQIPEQGLVGYLQVEGRREDGSLGDAERVLIFPSNVEGDFIAFVALTVNQTDGSAIVTGWSTDRARSVAYAYNVGDAATTDPPSLADVEAQGGTATGGGLVAGFTSDFEIVLPAGTLAYGEVIKLLLVAYIRADGTGADGTNEDHGPPVGVQGERFKISDPDQIDDGVVISQKLREGAMTLITDIEFGAFDWDTVEWGTGVVRLAGGQVYNIAAGNTGNMGSDAPRYIFLDPAISTTVLQVSVAESDAIGDGQILLAVAWRAPASNQEAAWVPRVGLLGINETVIGENSISTGKIQALAITTGLLAAGAVVAAKINVASLSAISADLGTVTAGTISTGVIVASGTFTAASIVASGTLELRLGTGGGEVFFERVSSESVMRISGRGSVRGSGSNRLLVTGITGLVVADGGTDLGFYGTTPVTQQTITGSRADPEQALQGVLSVLNALGLAINATSA